MPIRPRSTQAPSSAAAPKAPAKPKAKNQAAATAKPASPVAATPSPQASVPVAPEHAGTSGFSPASSGPMPADLGASVPQPKSLAAVFDALPSQGAGPADAKLLSKNLDAWNARWEMIDSAKSSIDTQYFIMEKDPFGYAFLGALLHKQLEGVQVRLMTDAMADTFGTHGFKAPLRGKDYLQELVNHGSKAWIYHPVWERPLDALKGGYGALASNHDKILVADGQRGITGGRNIGQEYFASPADDKNAWRDMDIAMEGAGPAKGLTAAFDAEVAKTGIARPVSKDRLGNWDKKDIQLLGAYAMMDSWLKAPAFTTAEKAQLRADPKAREKLAQQLVDDAVARMPSLLPPNLQRPVSDKDREFLTTLAGQLATQLDARGSQKAFHEQGEATRSTEVKILDQTSSAGTRTNGIAPELTALVDAAKSRIDIENPYVVLTEPMMQALERASARGVQITITTNSPLSTDSDVTQAFFLDDWKQILARCPTARIFVATGSRKFHIKSAVVDGQDAFVSSYNLDLLSGYVNGEVGAIVKSPELAADLSRAFQGDHADPANGFVEYTIQKDASGHAVLDNGEPITVFGPENHLPKDVLETYKKKSHLWGDILRNHLPQFEPLRHPSLEPKK